MTPVTLGQLLSGMPQARRAAEFVAPLNDAMARWSVDTPGRAAAFLAQAAHESSELNVLRENLNYSSEALRRVFPKYFYNGALADGYARQPERIANRVYANRMGNGDEASGDGWRNRGAGIFQLTGADNLALCSQEVYGDSRLLDDPTLLEQPEAACQSAGWFWSRNGLSAYADRAAFEDLTRRINGGLNGLASRVAYWHRFIEALAPTGKVEG